MTQQKHYKSLTIHAVSPLLCVFFTLTAHAQAPKPAATAEPATTEAVGIPHAPVVVNNRELFTLSGATADEALRRAATVEKRVQRLIEREEEVERFSPRDIISEDGQPLFTLGSEPATPIICIAAANLSSASTTKLRKSRLSNWPKPR